MGSHKLIGLAPEKIALIADLLETARYDYERAGYVTKRSWDAKIGLLRKKLITGSHETFTETVANSALDVLQSSAYSGFDTDGEPAFNLLRDHLINATIDALEEAEDTGS